MESEEAEAHEQNEKMSEKSKSLSQSLTLAPQPKQAGSLPLTQSQFFAELPPALLADMSAQFRRETWQKNHYIPPTVLQERFHILLDGRLEMKRSNSETGRELTLDVLQAGDSFDVITLLDDQPHAVTLSPLSKLVLLSVPMETMRQWLWTYPALNRQFMQYLAQKMRAQEDLSSSLVLQDVATRLSRLIMKNLYQVHPQTSAMYPINEADSNTTTQALIPSYQAPIIKGLSDEMIARMIGSVRQVVNKQLQHWKNEGVIDKKRNQLIVHDLDTLRDAARFDE